MSSYVTTIYDANRPEIYQKDDFKGINGKYHFYVHNYHDRSTGYGTPFKVELEVEGQIYVYQGELARTNEKETAFEFKYKKGQPIEMLQSNEKVATDYWNLQRGSFVPVTGITTSPNLWGEQSFEHNGNHTFFLLEGCRDQSQGKGRGFFNEMLTPDLKEIRKTLEAYTASTPINGADEATACGLGFSKDSDWNLTLKVTVDGVSRFIAIDRFD